MRIEVEVGNKNIGRWGTEVEVGNKNTGRWGKY
jgi:hypothetical protein